MNLTRSLSYATVLSAIFAVSSQAWAGCNCNVPPSPAPMSMSGPSWNASGGLAGDYGLPAGGSVYGGGVYSGAGTAAAMPYGGTVATNGPHWAPGGYDPRVGSPALYHDPAGGQYVVTGNPYYDHFGPGFHRDSLHGHYRFPYYNYRAPWYFPGRAVYNRNTNFAW